MILYSKWRLLSVNLQGINRCIYLMIYLLVTGCTQSALFLVNGLARFDDYSVISDISYGSSELNRLDIYIPGQVEEMRQTNRPVIVFFYGGCWGGCETGFKEDYLFVAQAFTNQDYVAVIADYRRYPEVRFPEIIDDARQATEWVKKNIENYGGNPESIFLMGHSAGAHLAALLTLDETYLSLETQKATRGFIGLSGPYDFLPFTKPYQRAVFSPKETYAKSQPINYVDGTEAPLLLLYGNDDETVKPRNIINLAEKVQQLGGKVETRYYDEIDHVGILGSLSIPLRDRKQVMTDIISFISYYHSQNDFKNGSSQFQLKLSGEKSSQ